MDIQTIKLQTEILVKRVQGYFDRRAKLPAQCTSNDHCNIKFLGSDLDLANTVNEIITKLNQQKTYSFGFGFMQFPSGCNFKRSCCSCPSKPNPYYEKNKTRQSTEKNLLGWLKAAKDWIEKGGNEIQTDSYTYTRAIGSKVGRKRLGLGNLED